MLSWPAPTPAIRLSDGAPLLSRLWRPASACIGWLFRMCGPPAGDLPSRHLKPWTQPDSQSRHHNPGAIPACTLRLVVLMSLIEDEPRIRDALTRAMQSLGHRVIAAEAGLPGLQVIVSDEPDIVILDLGLPDIDGLELLRMIRAVSMVPVIAATARDDEIGRASRREG